MSNGTIHSYELGTMIVEIAGGRFQVSFRGDLQDLGRVFDSLEAAQDYVYGKLTEDPCPEDWGSDPSDWGPGEFIGDIRDIFPQAPATTAKIIPFPRKDPR
jgi:hypothetical protein